MMFKILFFVVSVTLLSENVFAAYQDGSTCTFYRPGVPNCPGLVTSDVADFIGYYLNGAEDYALIKHPYGIYLLVSVDNVWYPSTASDLFINGVFAYVVYVNGTYYAHPTVGCTNGTILSKNDNRLVETTRTITYGDLYRAITQQNKFAHSCNIPCNVLQQRSLYGPSPVQQNFIIGGNVLIHTTSLQSCIITPRYESGSQLANEVKQLAYQQGLNVTIESSGSYNLKIIQNSLPNAPPCVPQSLNLFPGVKDFSPISSNQPNSGCYLATLAAQQLASPASPSSLLTYVEITIFERNKRGNVFFPGYLTSTIFNDFLDAFLSAC